MFRLGGRQLLVLGTAQKMRTATSVNNSHDREWVVSGSVQYKLNRGTVETPDKQLRLPAVHRLT
jgi:hypothetical protein